MKDTFRPTISFPEIKPLRQSVVSSRMTDQEYAYLSVLAQKWQITVSDLVRHFAVTCAKQALEQMTEAHHHRKTEASPSE